MLHYLTCNYSITPGLGLVLTWSWTWTFTGQIMNIKLSLNVKITVTFLFCIFLLFIKQKQLKKPEKRLNIKVLNLSPPTAPKVNRTLSQLMKIYDQRRRHLTAQCQLHQNEIGLLLIHFE